MSHKDKAALKAVKEQLRRSATVKQQISEIVRSREAEATPSKDDTPPHERRP